MRRFLWLAGLMGVLSAQETTGMAFARVGSAGAEFLSVELSPRAQAMGGAFTAAVLDASSVFGNPAGINYVTEPTLFVATLPYLVSTYFGGLAYVHPLDPYQKVYGFARFMNSSGFEGFEVLPDGTVQDLGTFSVSDLAVGVGYARRYTDRAVLSVQVKGIYERFGNFTSATGVALDVGSVYDLKWKGLRFGMAMRNLGPDLRPSGTKPIYRDGTEEPYDPYPLPLTFRLGIAMNPVENEMGRLTVAVDMEHPNNQAERFFFGAEYAYRDFLFLRAGYTTGFGGWANSVANETVHFGIGLQFSSFRVDYSYSRMNLWNDLHRFGLVQVFGKGGAQ